MALNKFDEVVGRLAWRCKKQVDNLGEKIKKEIR